MTRAGRRYFNAAAPPTPNESLCTAAFAAKYQSATNTLTVPERGSDPRHMTTRDRGFRFCRSVQIQFSIDVGGSTWEPSCR